jgi:(R,R)-butanediol dehydrogenase/meso-butanediol dehydrogenase/diacetyl reductase
MKAAVFKALGRPLAIEDVPEPKPARDEVLIKVGRCGICGSDLHMTAEAEFGAKPGTILGHEFSGEVIEAGAEVQRLKKGDRVAVAPLRSCGHCASCLAGRPAWCAAFALQGGGYAEYATATERQCRVLPKSVSLEDGALVEPLAVSLHGVNLSGLTQGARVVVLGAGPIGLATTFWARRQGAGKIVVRDLIEEPRMLALKEGASAFIPAREDMRAVTDALGGPADIVFECVGVPGVIAQAIEYVRPRGTVVVLGLCTKPDTFVPFRAVAKEVRIQTSAFFETPDFETVLSTLDQGAAEPHMLITGTVPLADMPTTFEALRHRTTQCKVMVAA